ncbi:MAG: trimeric intracellular cation channel family protein [Gammaproteobacteria bacterium]
MDVLEEITTLTGEIDLISEYSHLKLEDVLFWFTIVAVSVSAASGVLVAGKKQFDLFGIIIVALVTALGGGSVRDMLLTSEVFWIKNQLYLIVSLCAGIVTFFLARIYSFPLSLFLIPDAIGLATYSIAGTMSAMSIGAPWLIASFMGVVTGVAGGILRDMICSETPIVFKSTLYATLSWFGGLVFIGLIRLGVDAEISAAGAGAFIFLSRLAAIKWNLSLPVFNAKD